MQSLTLFSKIENKKVFNSNHIEKQRPPDKKRFWPGAHYSFIHLLLLFIHIWSKTNQQWDFRGFHNNFLLSALTIVHLFCCVAVCAYVCVVGIAPALWGSARSLGPLSWPCSAECPPGADLGPERTEQQYRNDANTKHPSTAIQNVQIAGHLKFSFIHRFCYRGTERFRPWSPRFFKGRYFRPPRWLTGYYIGSVLSAAIRVWILPVVICCMISPPIPSSLSHSLIKHKNKS